jgi:hypothetical protein
MKKIYYTPLALTVASVLILTGCFEEVSGPYDGPDRVGFSQYQQTGEFGATVSDGPNSSVSVPVQLIGPQRGESFSVGVSVQTDTAFRERQVPQGDGTDTTVVDVRADPTTAESGEYTVPSEVSFPQDTSNVTFEVEIGDALPNSDPDTTERVTLRLEPNPDSDIEVAENFRYFEVTVTN